jgi:hypothetical protein
VAREQARTDGRQVYSEDVKAELRRRHTAGEMFPQLAELTGIPFAQVKFICGNTKRKRELALGERL